MVVRWSRRHLAVQREMADGHYPLPDDVTTGDESRLLDDALSPGETDPVAPQLPSLHPAFTARPHSCG